MIRTLGLFGLAVGFLSISRELRNGVMSAVAGGVQSLETYSPYSYVAVVVLAFGSFLVSLKRGAQPR